VLSLSRSSVRITIKLCLASSFPDNLSISIIALKQANAWWIETSENDRELDFPDMYRSLMVSRILSLADRINPKAVIFSFFYANSDMNAMSIFYVSKISSELGANSSGLISRIFFINSLFNSFSRIDLTLLSCCFSFSEDAPFLDPIDSYGRRVDMRS